MLVASPTYGSSQLCSWLLLLLPICLGQSVQFRRPCGFCDVSRLTQPCTIKIVYGYFHEVMVKFDTNVGTT
jgi:hypothetical protein